MVERETIPNTPFMLIKHDELYHIAWGDYALTARYPAKDAALRLLKNDTWNVIGVYVISVMDMMNKLNADVKSLSEIMKMAQKKSEK